MSNYTKSTNFTAKDSLPTGDTNKVIRGSEFDTEFNAIQTSIGTKSDLASPTFTGTATFDGITATGTVNFTGGSVTTNIDGGTIDGVTIGGSSAGAGTFSSLTATTADINAGTVDNTVIGGTTPAAGTFSSLTATTADINGGSIDGAVIGGSTPAAISGTTGTFSGAVTGSNLNVSNWDTAYGWGDHGVEGYLTSVSFSDIDAGAVTLSSETFTNSDTQIPTNAAVRNWVLTTYPTIVEQNNLTLAVTWDTVPDAYISESSVTQHQAALSISTSQLAGGLSLSDITDVTATATEVNYTDGVTSNIQTQLDSKVGASYTGDVDITGELLVDSYNETFKQPSQGTTQSTFEWSVFTSSGNTKTLTGTDRRGIIQWKPDGTRFFVNDHGGSDAIHQFNVSTAYDFSTASLVSSTTSASAGFSKTNMVVVFSSDGQYLFGVERSTNSPLYRLTLNTAWSASGGSSSETTVRTLTSGGYTYCVDIADDGSKFYVLDDNDTISEYTFGTAYDPSTLGTTATATLVPSGGSGNVYQTFKFTNSGSNLLVLKNDGTTLLEYALSTAYDLSTVNTTPTQTLTVGTGSNSKALGVNPNKQYIYVVGNTAGTNTDIKEYSVTSTINTVVLDCEAANVFSTTLSGNTEISFSNPPASGTPVVSGYQLTSGSYDSKSFSVVTQENSPNAVEFSSDGTKMYILGTTQQTVYQYTLSTAFDVSTASYASTSFSVSAQDLGPAALRFKSDGTKMFVLGFANDAVYQYSLSTAWDVSTASYDSVSFSVATQTTTPEGLAFKSDGTEMYVCGHPSDDVYQYTLSTAWDLSTASYGSLTFTATGVDFTELAFNSDGTSLFLVDRTNDVITEYSLSTAWNISTATSSGNTLSVASQESEVKGLAFNNDGTKIYIVGLTNDTVYQYSTSVSNLNDSTAYAMSLKVVQDSGASGYTVTWPTSVDWPNATAPTLTATASAVDQFVFYTYDGGTTWYGFTAGQALG